MGCSMSERHSMSDKRSLLAFWSLELCNPQMSAFQVPGSGRAASSGLRSTLVLGSWRIYGPLSPIQLSRGASRYSAWFLLQLEEGIPGGGGQPEGLSHQSREYLKGSGILLRSEWWNEIRLWSSAQGRPCWKRFQSEAYSVSGERIAKSRKIKKKPFKVLPLFSVSISVFSDTAYIAFNNS